VHRLRRSQRISTPSATKEHVLSLKTAQKRSDDFTAYESLCIQMTDAWFRPEKRTNRLKTDTIINGETVNGRAIYCRFVRRWRGVGAQPWREVWSPSPWWR